MSNKMEIKRIYDADINIRINTVGNVAVRRQGLLSPKPPMVILSSLYGYIVITIWLYYYNMVLILLEQSGVWPSQFFRLDFLFF